MSKKKFADMTMSERQEVAATVRALRQDAGMTQAELAEAAGVSRATINTLETGTKVPQAENLSKVLSVFGLADDPEFDDQTETWLTMIGTLIEAIPSKRREPAVAGVLRELGREVRNANTDTPGEVIQVDFGRNVGGSDEDEATLPRVARKREVEPTDEQ